MKSQNRIKCKDVHPKETIERNRILYHRSDNGTVEKVPNYNIHTVTRKSKFNS